MKLGSAQHCASSFFEDKKDKLFCLLLFFLSSNFNDNIDNKNNVLPQAREAHVALPYVVWVVSVVVKRIMLFCVF